MNEQFVPIPPPPLRPATPFDVLVRRAIAWLAVAVLAGAVVVTFASVMEIISIWFDYQYVPIARAVLAGAVALVAVYVVRLMLRKPGL